MEIINTIIGLGASVMMPIIFFVVGLIFRMGIGKSFKIGRASCRERVCQYV